MKHYYIIYAIVGCLLLFHAEMYGTDFPVDTARITRCGGNIVVDMEIAFQEMKIPRKSAVVLTPWLVGSSDSAAFRSVGVYTRDRYWHYERQNSRKEQPDTVILKKKCPDRYMYIGICHTDNGWTGQG